MKSLEQLAAEYVHFTNGAREAHAALSAAAKELVDKATTREECLAICQRLPHGSHAWALAHDKGFRLTMEESARQFTIEGKANP